MTGFDAAAMLPGPGLSVIEASAGTGKTWAMVQLAVRILTGDAGIPSRGPANLLLVTFTRDATAELKERVRSALRQVERVATGRSTDAEQWMVELVERLGENAADVVAAVTGRLDELSVTTIHGFCVGVLEEYPHEVGVAADLIFAENDDELAIAVLDDLLRERSWTDSWFAAALVMEQWDRSELLGLLRDLGRIPRDKVHPTPDAEACFHLLNLALTEARQHWNHAEIVELFDRAVWHEGKSPFAIAEARKAILSDVGALLDGDAAGLHALGCFDRRSFLDGLRKQKKEQKAAAQPIIDHLAVAALMAARDVTREWLQHLRIELILELRDRLAARKKAEGIATFDDQIGLLSRALADPARGGRLARILHERFDAVMVDEAQDTDPAQWSIFHSAFANRPVIIVGDPKQSIYGWRGADLDAYLESRDTAGPERTWHLDRNWRSNADLLAALEQLHTRLDCPFRVPDQVMPFVRVTGGREVSRLDDPECSAALRWLVVPEVVNADRARGAVREQVVSEIIRLLDVATIDGERLRPGDIAILVRTRREGESYRSRLRAAGINAVLAGSGSITATEVWSDLQRVVEALNAPASDRRLRLAAATRLIGTAPDALAAWGTGDGADGAAQVYEVFRWAAGAAGRYGMIAALTRLMEEFSTVERLAEMADAERRLTDLRHAVEEVQRGEQEVGGGVRLQRWMALAAAGKGESEQRQLRLDSDADAVQVRTMHVSKGLEYPVVFVPEAWDVPSSKQRGIELFRDDGWRAAFGDGRTEPRVVAAIARARFEEAQRLAYVALTRARQCCYVALAATTTQKNRGAIGWLLRPAGTDDAGGGASELPATLQVLDELVAASHGTMAVISTERRTGVPRHRADPLPSFEVAPIDRERDWRSWTVFSYSAITAGDEGSWVPSAASSHPASDLDLLPPGAGSGIALHTLFEELPFDAGPDLRRRGISRLIDRYALTALLAGDDADRLATAIGAMADAVLDSPIPGTGLVLSRVDSARMLREWRFDLAVSRLDRRTLVAAFRECGGDEAAYADHLERLDDAERRGFLTGVIDLVAEHDGLWYLVDWKSNHLGRSRGGYGSAAMKAEMMESHYMLQYHLYLVALDRYLRSRLPQWNRATMLGGVVYPFLRGIRSGSTDGWHVVRPTEELLDRMTAVVTG